MENNNTINVQMTKEVFDTLGSGSNGGGSEPLAYKVYNDKLLGKTIEINDPITFQLVGNEFAKNYQAYFSLDEKEISKNTFDTLKFTNITLGDISIPNSTFESVAIYILKPDIDKDFALTNNVFSIDGFYEISLTKVAADYIGIPKIASSILGSYNTKGASDDATINDVNITLRNIF